MTNQEIFEALSEREEKTFYAYCSNPTEDTKAAHEIAKRNLVDFAKRTGCHN